MTKKKSATRILVVEDEQPIREMLRFALESEDFSVSEAEDIASARAQLTHCCPNLVLLDWMLPGGSGIELAKSMRKNPITKEIAIIMLTARAEEENRIKGLQMGADDYVVKPFSPAELIARIRAVLRRGPIANVDSKLEFKELILDTEDCSVLLKGCKLTLAPTEYHLLKFFMSHQKKVYSRDQIMYYIWGRETFVGERTIDVHIRRLRKQLQQFSYHTYIRTVRSMGYMFAEEG